MDEKTLMGLLGTLEKGELITLIGFMIKLGGPAKQVAEDYCRKNAKLRDSAQDVEEEFRQHWKNAQPTVEMFNTCGGGSKSDEDDIREELKAMEDLLGKQGISWTVRKEVLDEMLEEVASDNSGLTDVLVDLAVKMCRTKEERIYLADFLADYGNSFYKNFAAAIYAENGKEGSADGTGKTGASGTAQSRGKAPEAGAGQKPTSASEYVALANQYKKQGDAERAFRTAIDGLANVEGRLFEIYDYLFRYYVTGKDEAALVDLYRTARTKKQDRDFLTELLYGYYKEQGNYENQKKMLSDLFSCADARKLTKWYHTGQKELTAADFAAEEGKILSTIKERNLSAYFDICMEKGNTEEILDYLKNNRKFQKDGVDAGHRFSKQLAAGYPKEVLAVYWREVDHYAEIGDEESCRHAVEVLREIHEIMEQNSWTDEWNERYNDFIRDSISNPLLIGELAKF